MAELKDKVKMALDEARMLILGAQILLGFEYRSFLEPGTDTLPRSWRFVKLLGLVFILLTNCLLMWPATFQQLAESGEATARLNRFANRIMCYALLPFAAALGIDVFITIGRFGGLGPGLAAGAVATGIALFFWYFLGFWQKAARAARAARTGSAGAAGKEKKRRRAMPKHSNGRSDSDNPADGDGDGERGAESKESEESGESKVAGTPLKDKINDVLTEGRVILPGAQAVLGFQLIVMLSPGFDKLPRSSQYVHLASLALMALSTILLMTAPAYHRIVEDGECTQPFFRFASRMLLAAMAPLAAGMAGDFFVVARKVTDSAGWSAAASAALLAAFYGAWFGYTLYRRGKTRTPGGSRAPRELAGVG